MRGFLPRLGAFHEIFGAVFGGGYFMRFYVRRLGKFFLHYPDCCTLRRLPLDPVTNPQTVRTLLH